MQPVAAGNYYGCGYVKSKDSGVWRNLGVILHLYVAVGWLADSRHVELIRSPNAE
ncbi:hypothetical protein ACLK1T_03850 [Escherichia coli]